MLATVDKPLTIVLEPLGGGKIRVRTSSWDQEELIVRIGCSKQSLWASLRLVCSPRPLEHLDYEPTGLAEAGYGPVGGHVTL